MILRRAYVEEADRLTAIAHAAKRHWGYPESWIQAWRDQLTITPEFIEANLVEVAVEETVAVGFVAVLRPTECHAVIDHLWVLPTHMGRGIGAALFHRACHLARDGGAHSVHIESDPHAESFYLHHGARRTGTRDASRDGVARVLPLLEVALGRSIFLDPT